MMERLPPHKREHLRRRFQHIRRHFDPANRLDGATLHLSDNKYVISYAKGKHPKGRHAEQFTQNQHDKLDKHDKQPNFVRGFDGKTHWMIYPRHPQPRHKMGHGQGPRAENHRRPRGRHPGKKMDHLSADILNNIMAMPGITPQQKQQLQQLQTLPPMERRAFIKRNPELRALLRQSLQHSMMNRTEKIEHGTIWPECT